MLVRIREVSEMGCWKNGYRAEKSVSTEFE